MSSRRAMVLFLTACCLFGLLAGASHSPAARDLDALAETAEWQRVVTLWHALVDHSSDLIYSRARFDELTSDLDEVDAGLTALAERDLLPQQVAEDLRWLVHSRYEYIRAHNYTTDYQVQVTLSESTRGAASWIVELQLSLLRNAYPSPDQNQKLITAAESNLAYELTFLHHFDNFEAEAARRRADLKAREDKSETVDWEAFDTDCQRRRSLLVEAYRARRIPRVRRVEDLLLYVSALTRSRPAAPAPTLDLSGLDP